MRGARGARGAPPAASWAGAELDSAERKQEPALNAPLVLLPLQTLLGASSPPRAWLSHAPNPSPEPEISATAPCPPGRAILNPQSLPPANPLPTTEAGRLILPSCLLPAAHNCSLTPPPTLSSFSTGEFSHILPPFYSINVSRCFFYPGQSVRIRRILCRGGLGSDSSAFKPAPPSFIQLLLTPGTPAPPVYNFIASSMPLFPN